MVLRNRVRSQKEMQLQLLSRLHLRWAVLSNIPNRRGTACCAQIHKRIAYGRSMLRLNPQTNCVGAQHAAPMPESKAKRVGAQPAVPVPKSTNGIQRNERKYRKPPAHRFRPPRLKAPE